MTSPGSSRAYVEPDDERFWDDPAWSGDSGASIEFDDRASFLLGVDLRARGETRHLQAVAGFLAGVERPGNPLRSWFLREAELAGHWSESLLDSRLRALRRGCSGSPTAGT
ncbi:MAG: hypothetical protein IPM29_24655 [Planctomycetes bacterium]|nr:hypothetical protein [Planctomycetota bacterium]